MRRFLFAFTAGAAVLFGGDPASPAPVDAARFDDGASARNAYLRLLDDFHRAAQLLHDGKRQAAYELLMRIADQPLQAYAYPARDCVYLIDPRGLPPIAEDAGEETRADYELRCGGVCSKIGADEFAMEFYRSALDRARNTPMRDLIHRHVDAVRLCLVRTRAETAEFRRLQEACRGTITGDAEAYPDEQLQKDLQHVAELSAGTKAYLNDLESFYGESAYDSPLIRLALLRRITPTLRSDDDRKTARRVLLNELGALGDTAGRNAWRDEFIRTLGPQSDEGAELFVEWYYEGHEKRSAAQNIAICRRAHDDYSQTARADSFLARICLETARAGRRKQAMRELRTLLDAWERYPSQSSWSNQGPVGPQYFDRRTNIEDLQATLAKWYEQEDDPLSALSFRARQFGHSHAGCGLYIMALARDKSESYRRLIVKCRLQPLDVETLWEAAAQDFRASEPLAHVLADAYASRIGLDALEERLELETKKLGKPAAGNAFAFNDDRSAVELVVENLESQLPLLRMRERGEIAELIQLYVAANESDIGPWGEQSRPRGDDVTGQLALALLVSVPEKTAARIAEISPINAAERRCLERLQLMTRPQPIIDTVVKRIERVAEYHEPVFYEPGRTPTIEDHQRRAAYFESREHRRRVAEVAECRALCRLLSAEQQTKLAAKSTACAQFVGSSGQEWDWLGRSPTIVYTFGPPKR